MQLLKLEVKIKLINAFNKIEGVFFDVMDSIKNYSFA